MPLDIEPIEGTWYEYVEDGGRFFVVTVDEEEGIVEFQNDDGTTSEMNLDAWHEADLVAIDPPDEAGLFDEDIEQDEDDQQWRHGENPEDDEWGEPLPDLEE